MGEIVKKDIAKIDELLNKVLGTDLYSRLERLGGLTNHSYRVTMTDGREFVVRIPGDGTEELIVRGDEKISTELACKLGIDAQMLYFGDDGSKVTEYIPNAVTMTPETMRDEKRIPAIAAICRKIHDCGENTGVPFEVFDMAAGYEKIINDLNVPMFDDYAEQKKKVMDIKAQIDETIGAPIVPCHNDPLCANWVEGDGRLYLIDWEYAGMNDGMWDIAAVSIEAEYEETQDEQLLREYTGHAPEAIDWKHLLASKIYVDYLWTLWAKTRVPYAGQPMEDWAVERYERMKGNIGRFEEL